MASTKSNAPACPKCNRSEGILTEATAGFEWRRGKWRLVTDIEYTPDLNCPCGYNWSPEG